MDKDNINTKIKDMKNLLIKNGMNEATTEEEKDVVIIETLKQIERRKLK